MAGRYRALKAMGLRLLAAAFAVTVLLPLAAQRGVLDSVAFALQTNQSYRGGSQASPYSGTFADLATAIDTFWQVTLGDAQIPYRSPRVVAVDSVRDSGCGLLSPGFAAAYCSADSTIYLDPNFLAEQEQSFGDYAPITILAHEWGHHIQAITRVPDSGGNAFELQADCLAGVYTKDAEAQGLLEPGDITEAILTSQSAGDPLGLPQDRPGSHGINDDRIKAFMRGYLNGLQACQLPSLSVSSSVSSADQESPDLRPASAYLPNTLPVTNASCFEVTAQGDYPYADVVAFLSETGASSAQINALDWQDGAYIDYTCADPPPDGASFLEVVLHRFATPEAARTAEFYWQTGYVPSQANELYLCSSSMQFVVCVDGRGPSGRPNQEVRDLLDQVLDAVSGTT